MNDESQRFAYWRHTINQSINLYAWTQTVGARKISVFVVIDPLRGGGVLD